jgi:uncharacterized protein YcbK (DUF882 family)
MGDLSDNFSRREFACNCCGLCNVAPQLVVALQILRHRLGRPIRVLSGCRSEAHNRAVRGSRNSQHLTSITRQSMAADIKILGVAPEELARAAAEIEEFRKGGIGVYSWGVHADVRDAPRPVRWGKKWRD